MSLRCHCGLCDREIHVEDAYMPVCGKCSAEGGAIDDALIARMFRTAVALRDRGYAVRLQIGTGEEGGRP